MRKRRSQQYKWQRDPRNPNWRGQRPKFNPLEKPETVRTAKRICDAYLAVNNHLKKMDAKGNPVDTISNLDPKLLTEIRRQQIIYEESFEASKDRMRSFLQSMLSDVGE